MAKKHSIVLAANALTDLTGGGIPAGEGGTYLLNLCNREGANRTFRVAITTGANAQLADYIDYDVAIEAHGAFSRWPIPLDPGWRVFLQASATGLSATLIGLERT